MRAIHTPRYALLGALFLALGSATAVAEDSTDFGDYVVHYAALMTDVLPTETAQLYNIRRSDSSALLNVTVMQKSASGTNTAVKAGVRATAQNLTGQRRDIELREITEPPSDGDAGAVYYIGVFRVHNGESFDFKIEVTPEGASEPLVANFRQQFYTQ